MHNYKEVLRYYYEEKQSQRFIAKALKMGRSTISDITFGVASASVGQGFLLSKRNWNKLYELAK